MPFGLMNAPATFQRSMNHVLQGLEHFSICYIDDIVVHSRDWDYHVKQIREVLARLKQFGLTANQGRSYHRGRGGNCPPKESEFY